MLLTVLQFASLSPIGQAKPPFRKDEFKGIDKVIDVILEKAVTLQSSVFGDAIILTPILLSWNTLNIVMLYDDKINNIEEDF